MEFAIILAIANSIMHSLIYREITRNLDDNPPKIIELK